jgi:hypothetical protein
MSDEPSPEVRALAERLFEAARSERPGPALRRRLALIGQTPALHGSQRVEARVESSRARMLAWRPLWLAAAAVCAAGAALWLVSADPAAPISISADRVQRAQPAESELPESMRRAAVVEVAPETRADSAERGRAEPSRAVLPRKSADDAPRAASVPRAPGAAPKNLNPMTLLDELELLKGARAALRGGQGQQALDLLDRHARERPGSSLEAEATLLRIEAFSALGRKRDASELATRFVRDHPNSALGDRAKTFIRPSAQPTP